MVNYEDGTIMAILKSLIKTYGSQNFGILQLKFLPEPLIKIGRSPLSMSYFQNIHKQNFDGSRVDQSKEQL